MEADILTKLDAVQHKLDSKSRVDAWYIIIQTFILVATTVGGAAWTMWNHWHEQDEKKAIPPRIEVQITLEDLGTTRDHRLVRARFAVENKGSIRAYVIHSNFAVQAQELEFRAAKAVGKNAWDADWLREREIRTLISRELFGRGFWFEPGERDVRSVVVAVPKKGFDLITAHAEVRHAKVLDDAVRTKWSWDADHSLVAKLYVHKKRGRCETVADACEEYNRETKHREIYETQGIALNDSYTELPLWDRTPADVRLGPAAASSSIESTWSGRS